MAEKREEKCRSGRTKISQDFEMIFCYAKNKHLLIDTLGRFAELLFLLPDQVLRAKRTVRAIKIKKRSKAEEIFILPPSEQS